MLASKKITNKNVSVLVVDDDLIVREGIKCVAVDMGLNIVGEADNGLEAVGLSTILKPDVILMDMNMPKMNGLEATPYCCGKVIIVTGSDLSNIAVEAQNAGAIACLSKPVNPLELEQAIAGIAMF
jgi:CheY-like chemotaxis protein